MSPDIPPNPGSRRSLPKSRKGCKVCKARKVKCDEQRPRCSNCEKRGDQCEFTSSAPHSITSSFDPPTLTRPAPADSSTEPDHRHLSSSPAAPLGSHDAAGFTIDDLQLLHHYTTSTCLTFSTEPLIRNFWRVQVPHVGFHTNYVLRGILSLAALHLAHFRPNQRESWLNIAAAHHNAALAVALPLLDHMAADDYLPLFFFSTVTSYYALAKPKQSEDLLIASNGALPEWLFLLRGVRSILDAQRDNLPSSHVASFFQSGKKMNDLWEANAVNSEPLAELSANIRSFVDHPRKLNALLGAVDSLRRSFAFIYGDQHPEDYKLRCTFIWLYKIRDDYLNLVRDRDPEALCVLGFFCVLLRRLEPYWWMEGWSSHLMGQIYIILDKSYRTWLRWPCEEMGWVPQY